MSVFESERARLAAEIAKGFEELISASNHLNRTLEDGHGLSSELGNIAELWTAFKDLMKKSSETEDRVDSEGIPGTGGHLVAPRTGKA